MTKLIDMRLYGTTSGAGALTVAGGSIFGALYAVQWIDGTFADGVDAVLSYTATDGTSVTLLTLTNANDDKTYFPRVLVQDAAGADITGQYDLPLIAGPVTLAVTSGGDTRAGGCILYFVEER